MESLVSGARRSITTPITPVQTAVILESNPSVILDKKTLRNYTPRESSCLLRQFEEERLYSGRDKTAASSSQFSSLTSRKRGGRGSSEGKPGDLEDHGGTCRSQWSAWSAASSAASFDWHAGTSARARVPPEGSSLQSDSPGGPRPYEVTQVRGSKAQLVEEEEEEKDELDNLRKLLKEGRIAGLDDLPPSFTPPSPPSKASKGKERKQKVASPGSSRPSRPPADKRAAPQPPGDELKPPPPTSSVQFLGGRRVQSVEDISTDGGKNVSTDPNISRNPRPTQQLENLKRSTSMHDHNPSKGNKNYYGILPASHYTLQFFRICWQIQPN